MSASDGTPPATLGVPLRFQVLEELSAGGTTRVLRARDTVLEREVFLEVAALDLAAGAPDDAGRQRRLREARALARVVHPQVQRLLEVIETEHGAVLVLEPVAGETLAARLAREGRLGPDEVLRIGIAASTALEAVHAAGVLHRRIDARALVLGEDGRVTLTGFELAKPAPSPADGASPSSLVLVPSRPGTSDGHPAPEQLTRRQDSPRADIFSLGWTLYECLTGAAPFAAPDPLTWGSPPSARAAVPEVPRELDRALAHCLALSPTARPADAATLRRALEGLRAASGPLSAAPPAGATKAASRAWTAVAAGALVALAALVVGLPHPTEAAATPPRGLFVVGAGTNAAPSPPRPARTALQAVYRRSRALLVGITDYAAPFRDLPNAERDVAALRDVLAGEANGRWEIQTLLGAQASRAGVVDAFHDLCNDAQADDRLLVYFAGHGKRNEDAEGVGWMIPADATERPSSWIPFNEFDQVFREDPGAKHILVAIDCCYGGRLIQMMPMRSGDDTAFAERFLTRRAHVVIASGLGDQQVTDGVSGTNSPFARAIVAALARPGPPITASELYAEIQREFARLNLAQVPLLGRSAQAAAEGGDYIFYRNAR